MMGAQKVKRPSQEADFVSREREGESEMAPEFIFVQSMEEESALSETEEGRSVNLMIDQTMNEILSEFYHQDVDELPHHDRSSSTGTARHRDADSLPFASSPRGKVPALAKSQKKYTVPSWGIQVLHRLQSAVVFGGYYYLTRFWDNFVSGSNLEKLLLAIKLSGAAAMCYLAQIPTTLEDQVMNLRILFLSRKNMLLLSYLFIWHNGIDLILCDLVLGNILKNHRSRHHQSRLNRGMQKGNSNSIGEVLRDGTPLDHTVLPSSIPDQFDEIDGIIWDDGESEGSHENLMSMKIMPALSTFEKRSVIRSRKDSVLMVPSNLVADHSNDAGVYRSNKRSFIPDLPTFGLKRAVAAKRSENNVLLADMMSINDLWINRNHGNTPVLAATSHPSYQCTDDDEVFWRGLEEAAKYHPAEDDPSDPIERTQQAIIDDDNSSGVSTCVGNHSSDSNDSSPDFGLHIMETERKPLDHSEEPELLTGSSAARLSTQLLKRSQEVTTGQTLSQRFNELAVRASNPLIGLVDRSYEAASKLSTEDSFPPANKSGPLRNVLRLFRAIFTNIFAFLIGSSDGSFPQNQEMNDLVAAIWYAWFQDS